MRKRTKRLLAVFMATAMLAGMTGCGTSGSALDTATSEKKTEKQMIQIQKKPQILAVVETP